MSKKILYFAVCFMFLYSLVLAPLALSASSDFGLKETGAKAGYATSGTKANLYTILAQVISVGLSLIGVLFFGLMLYSGFRWMTARGNQEFVDKAKHNLEAATAGFIIVVLSYAISSFVFSQLAARGLVAP